MSLRFRFPRSLPSRRSLAPLLVPPALAAFAVVACVEEPSIPKLGDQGIEVTVTPSAFLLHAGEIDTITVTITNHVAEQVSLVFPSTCPVRPYIRDADGRIQVPEGGVHSNCPPIQSQLLIPAGGAVTREFYWTGGTQFDALPASPRLPAGRYYVSANLDAEGFSTLGFAVLITLVD